MVHGLMDAILRTKTKTLSLRQIIFYLSLAVYHSKNHVIPHRVICSDSPFAHSESALLFSGITDRYRVLVSMSFRVYSCK